MTTGGWPGPALDDEQRMLVDLVDSVMAEVRGEGAAGVPWETARERLRVHGVWGLGMPEDLGGGGAGVSTVLLALQRVARTDPALALGMAHAHAAVAVLENHQQSWAVARRVADGAAAGVVDGRGDAARVRLAGGPRGGASADAVRHTLAGTVERVDAGPDLAVLVVLDPHGAQEGARAGVRETVAVVPADAAGVEVGAPHPRTGLAGAASRPVVFRDCRLDPDAVVPARTDWSRQLLQLGFAAVACGLAEAAHDAAVRYVAEREQFGRRLAAFPVIQGAVAASATTVRSMLHTVLGIAGAADAPGAARVADCALAVRAAVRGAVQVATTAVQLHGGYGYLAEYRVEGMLRDAVSLRAAAAAVSPMEGGT